MGAPLQDISALERPQLRAYIPVGELYMRRRRSGLTQKYSAAVMPDACWQPTGKDSPHTAHCASLPNLRQSMNRFFEQRFGPSQQGIVGSQRGRIRRTQPTAPRCQTWEAT